jgi:hypothetical protein
MAVTAPTTDPAGAAIDAQIDVLQALVSANVNPKVEYQLQQALNQWQVEAVDHYMVTGWLNAATILATYSAPTWDKVGAILTARVTFLQNLYNNAPTPPVGNANGYGDSGWVTVAQNYQQQLYAAQISLVERIMDVPGGTTAATILANMTGTQTTPAGIAFEYVFDSVGFTDAWIDD